MRQIALMNQKGGVGKTTSTVNLAAALARAGQRVLIVDVDPQAHSTTHYGIELKPGEVGLYDMLTKSATLASAVRKISDNLSIVASSIDLAGVEMELSGVVGRELLLRDQLTGDLPYDYILFDCPPSLGVLTINALTAANEVFVPLQPHFLALHGLSKLFETVQLVAKRLNSALRITGVILCMYETGTRLSAEIVGDLEAFLEASQARPDSPWSQAKLFTTRIRRNIKLAESASFGQSIFEYDKSCHGAKDYASLAEEVMQQTASQAPGGLKRPTLLRPQVA